MSLQEAMIDSCVIVGFFVKTDPWHDQARSQVAALSRAKISMVSVSEVLHRLRKLPVTRLYSVMNAFFLPPFQIVDSNDRDLLYAMHLIETLGLSGFKYDNVNDLMIYSSAQRSGLKVITYDKHFRKLMSELEESQANGS
ncbi:PIN domain-containing protein [Tardisphaera miroshnichenkoae]